MSYDKTKTFDRADEELDKAVKVKEKSWGDYFTEPIETLYIQMHDNKTFKYTSSDEGEIDLNTQALQMWFEKVNKSMGTDYKIGNIKLILHNHRKNSKFSDRDYRTNTDLKNHGFNGYFLMYSNLSKKLYNIDGTDMSAVKKKEDNKQYKSGELKNK